MPRENGAFFMGVCKDYRNLFLDIRSGQDRGDIGHDINQQYNYIFVHAVNNWNLPYIRRKITKKMST